MLKDSLKVRYKLTLGDFYMNWTNFYIKLTVIILFLITMIVKMTRMSYNRDERRGAFEAGKSIKRTSSAR